MNQISSNLPPRIVIIGGGFSGAAVARSLAELELPVIVTVIEPREELGRGLAYSSANPTHRINVPGQRMSLDPTNRDDFVDWLASAEVEGRVAPDKAAVHDNAEIFTRRAVYGQYVAERVEPHVASGRIRHIRDRAEHVQELPNGSFILTLSDGARIPADVLVLATGHPPPGLAKPFDQVADHPALIADPYDLEAIAAVPHKARVLVVGAALTSADVIAALDGQGFAGKITSISRHGLRSRGHGEVSLDFEVSFTDPPLAGTSDLLARVRHALIDAEACGHTWHTVFHHLRLQGQEIWATLGPDGRSRLMRHLRTLWDVHRYRLAPQVEQVIDRLIAGERLRYIGGYLKSATAKDGQLVVKWRRRGTARIETRIFDRVIITTGPAHARSIETNPILSRLHELGHITPDPLGLGIATTETCHALDREGQPSRRVFVAGPLARGHIGELVGAPECGSHALSVARDIADYALRQPIAPFPY